MVIRVVQGIISYLLSIETPLEEMMLDKFITYQHGKYSQYSGLHYDISCMLSCYSC